MFGDGNYYLEIQNHDMVEEKEVLDGVLDISRELNIPIVATNDVHYTLKKDADMQRVLIAIQTNKVVGGEGSLEFSNDEFYLKSGDEMAQAFCDFRRISLEPNRMWYATSNILGSEDTSLFCLEKLPPSSYSGRISAPQRQILPSGF